jgi:hypothetical protein
MVNELHIQQISKNLLLVEIDQMIDKRLKSTLQIPTPEAPDRYLGTDEARKLLGGVSSVCMWEWRKKQIITGYRIGSKVMYKYSELMACGKMIVK